MRVSAARWFGAAAIVTAFAGSARAEGAAGSSPSSSALKAPVLDRAVARFYAPEMGGTARPRFVDERTLAFEARVEAIAEGSEEVEAGGKYAERHVREALEHHVGEEVLAALAAKLIGGLPANRRPSDAELGRIESDLGSALLERLGGRARVEAAAAAEQLDKSEVDALLHRQAMAAWYLDRAVSPILQATDEQLREVYRTSAHPYRGQPFEQVRAALGRWFVVERLRSAESAFYQGARTRLTIVVMK